MAEKVRINTDFILTSGSNTNNPNDVNKLGISFEKEIKESSRIKVQILADSDEDIALPDALCNFIAIYSDQDIDITLNGGSVESLKTLKAGVKAPVLMKACDLESLNISNPSTTKPVNLDIFVLKV